MRETTPIPAAFAKTARPRSWSPIFLGEVSPVVPTKPRAPRQFRSSFGDLNSQEERHFFVQFDVDEKTCSTKIEREKEPCASPPWLPPTKPNFRITSTLRIRLIETLSVVELLDSLLVTTNLPGGWLLTYPLSRAKSLTRSLDPNYIQTRSVSAPVVRRRL